MNPNNCKTCDHIHHKDGGHCYMYRKPPTAVCMSHTGRVRMWRDLLKPNPWQVFEQTPAANCGQDSKEKPMDDHAFKQAYNESRNGANFLVRHPFVGRFKFSDGVQELAEHGCYWLLDILATELVDHFRNRPDDVLIIVKVTVADESAVITASASDDDAAPWVRSVGYTDMPEGEWKFIVGQDEPGRFTMILCSEH